MPWVELIDPPKSAVRRIKETFAGRAKYLVDESVGIGIYRYIQSLGHNARFGPDLGLRTDQEVFARGWYDRRVILTHDHDFMNDREFPFNRNPGVIELPGASGVPVGLREAVLTVLNIFGHVRGVFSYPKIVITADNVWHVRDWNKDDGAIRQLQYRFTATKSYIWEPG